MKKIMALLLAAACFLTSGCVRRGYRVVFNPNGGEVLSGETEQRVAPGESAVAPLVEREGHILHWDGDFSAVSGDMVVTARWEKESCSMEFELGEGVLLAGETRQSVPYGESAVPPEASCGRRSLRWEGEYGCVRADTVVTARWEKTAADGAELAAYLNGCTARLRITSVQGGESAGTGVFLRPDGVLATTARTVEMMESAEAVLSDGRTFPVTEVLCVNRAGDLALLKVAAEGLPFLVEREGDSSRAFTLTEGALAELPRPERREGESFLRGERAGAERGGAIVDEYGELLGLWSGSRDGDEACPAVDAETIAAAVDSAGAGTKTADWAEKVQSELEESYSPRDTQGNYHYSLLRTYQSVTGAECLASVDSEGVQTGYVDCCDHYVYGLDEGEAERYAAYLTEQGFTCRGEEHFAQGSSVYYGDERSGLLVDLFRSNGGELWIWVSVEE